MDIDRYTLSSTHSWTIPWLEWLDTAIGVEIERMRIRYELSLDEFRGLYISDEQVDRLVHRRLGDTGRPALADTIARAEAARASAANDLSSPIAAIAKEFDFDLSQIAAIMVALAPEIDIKYQTLYAYLNNDVTRKTPTVDLLLRLAGGSLERFQPNSPVFSQGLLKGVRQDSQSWLAATVQASEPLLQFALSGAEQMLDDDEFGDDVEIPARLLDARLQAIVLEESRRSVALSFARAVSHRMGRPLVRFTTTNETLDDLRLALLRCRLASASLFVDLSHLLHNPDSSDRLASGLVEIATSSPVTVIVQVPSRSNWRPIFECVRYESCFPSPLSKGRALECWSESLGAHGLQADSSDLLSVVERFNLHETQIRGATEFLRRHSADEKALSGVQLAAGARAQCSANLAGLARKEKCDSSWDQLILPDLAMRRLQEFASAVKCRSKVFGDWGYESHSSGSRSLRALFSGISGGGKTLSAKIVANELGVDLYRIDLSAVMSKYIGETEKNLEKVFQAAEGSNAILFFDEADALFGKRTEVSDAHDRYANVETAFLLQRMEEYDGVMILATNLSGNLDEAFSRRIHWAIEFAMPDRMSRERLWRLLIPSQAPVADDIDFGFLAWQFELTGGDIGNVALNAGFQAAHEDVPIGMRHIVRALAKQRLKQGKSPSASEFKQYYNLIEW